MMRSGEDESQRPTNYQSYLALMESESREVYSPPRLPLNPPPELMELLVARIKEHYPCPRHQNPQDSAEKTKIFAPPETPAKQGKLKAINFPFSKIIIGKWTRTAFYPEDLKVKLYFAKRKLLWETLDYVRIGRDIVRRKRKMEMEWADILSLKRSYNTHNNTGLLEVELGKRPTFYMEVDPKPGKHTQWNKIDDFTPNQDASTYRRHTLYFDDGVLQQNFEKHLSGHKFWSGLIKADNFPTLRDSLCFDIGYGNNNSSYHSQDETLNFRVNANLSYGNNSSSYNSQGQTLLNFEAFDVLNHHSQGFGHSGAGEGNLNMATQYYGNDGRSFVQDSYHQTNTANQLFGTQPSSQIIYSFGSKFHNPMIQDQSQMGYTGEELLATQSDAQGLLETQTNSMMFPQTNQVPFYPQAGSYNVQDKSLHDDLDDYDKYFNHDGSLPPNL